MKLLLLQPMDYLFSFGGGSKANRILIEGLAGKGHSCRVLTPLTGIERRREDQLDLDRELVGRGINPVPSAQGVTVFHYNGVEAHVVIEGHLMRQYLIDQIREFQPTWILVSEVQVLSGLVLLETAMEVAASRVVYISHSPATLPFGPDSFSAASIMTGYYSQMAGIITVSNYLKEYIKQWGGAESTVIPFPAFGDGSFPHLGRFGQGFVTLINPSSYKGISIFLELAQRLPEVKFAAVPTWGILEEDRIALQRLSNVKILEPSEDIDRIFSRTSILLVPSLWGEAFSLVTVEAMLRGIPVLASNSGGLPEAKMGVDYVLPVNKIQRYEESIDERMNLLIAPVVPEQDLEPWMSALNEMLSDPARYERLSMESRTAALRYVSNLSVDPFEEYLENLTPITPDARNKDRGWEKRAEVAGSAGHLPPEKRALLTMLLKKKAQDSPAKQKIPRRRGTGPAPLSFQQQGLWFLYQLEPDSTSYNIHVATCFYGQFNIAALELTLGEIVRRHEILRATFGTIDGQPVQIFSPFERLVLPLVDLSELSEQSKRTEAQRLAEEESQRAFNLAEGPPLRVISLRINSEEHVLLKTAHHIVTDGWSMSVFYRELAELYEAFSSGRPSPLPELTIQYSDYADWQRKTLTEEALEAEVRYWRKRLGGALPALQLPGERSRPRGGARRGATNAFRLSHGLSESLKAFSQRTGVTLFMTLLAAFKALLFRYTGETDIIVGTPLANRDREEVAGLIGFFVKVLVLRTDLREEPNFEELLRRVKETALGAYAHPELPFERVVQELKPERDLSHTPVFQVMFALHNAPVSEAKIRGVRMGGLKVETESAKMDLSLAISEYQEELIGWIDYNADLFEEELVSRMGWHFERLLQGIINCGGERVSRLPLLSEAEQFQMLEEWNETNRDYAPDLCLHELFEAQVERIPEATAVIFRGEQISYRELNQRSNQLARRLRELGVKIESRVGICLPRSIEMVTAVIAVMKAGAAYVPLDVGNPKARLRVMVKDEGLEWVLLPEGQNGWLRDEVRGEISLDGEWEEISLRGVENLKLEVRGKNLAGVLYTSGSTGEPKGVMLSHRGLSNRLRWGREEYELREGDRFLQVAPLGFDIALWEMMGPLIAGGSVVMVEDGAQQDAEKLIEIIKREEVSDLHLTPSMLGVMLKQRGWGERGNLKRVYCGGEVLSLEVKQGYEETLEIGLEHFYGPTEASINATAWRVERGRREMRIGRAIANTQVYVLDEGGNPTPRGVVGELCIGGEGLARGYLDRPGLTAEKFIPDQYGRWAGGRLYRTGDVTKWDKKGKLQYLGRIDGQVKVRGMRVEPAEIEAALGAHRMVKECVVVGEDDDRGGKRLVAYVVWREEGEGLGVGELKRHLRERLPEYMTPSVYAQVKEIPRTVNGKADRRKLSAVGNRRAEMDAEYLAPRSEMEEIIASIWSEVLGVERVGVNDSFFDVGGHSLLATVMVSRINEAFHLELPLRTIFETPTIAGLTVSIVQAQLDQCHSDALSQWLLQLNQPT